MRTFDLAPLYRSTVGFDRLFSMLDGFEAAPGYPPYNIERTGENDYRITVAVAGFGESELSIVSKENTLTISEKQASRTTTARCSIRATLPALKFQLADYVQVKGRNLEKVSARRVVRDPKKPRQIAIGNGAKPQVVDTKAPPNGATNVQRGSSDGAPRNPGRAVPSVFARQRCGVSSPAGADNQSEWRGWGAGAGTASAWQRASGGRGVAWLRVAPAGLGGKPAQRLRKTPAAAAAGRPVRSAVITVPTVAKRSPGHRPSRGNGSAAGS